MTVPFLSYSTFNRLGLTQRNINSLLSSTDDFELHILDNNSTDNTWDFLQSLKDSRIVSIERLPVNVGPIYAVNYNMRKRKAGQYFFVLESDVYIYTPDWITRFMKVFETFPEVGLLGLPRAEPYKPFISESIYKEKDGVNYLELKEGKVGGALDFVPGHCQALRPELIDIIGYWCEECYYGDAELSVRVNNYTPYRAGYVMDVAIDMHQYIPCAECKAKPWCTLNTDQINCFKVRDDRHKNEDFAEKFKWKYLQCFKNIEEGKKSVYCASINDPESLKRSQYNFEWAQENFAFYIQNSN